MGDDLYTHTISVYNRFSSGLPPFGNVTTFQKTIIRNVHWEEDIDKSPDPNGKPVITQTVLILIPAEANQSGKIFLSSNEFNSVPVDQKKNFWTLDTGDDNLTYVILGEGRDITSMYTISQLEADGGKKVKGISNMLNFDTLPHIECRAL